MTSELQTERLNLGPWREADLDGYEALVRERDPRAASAPRDGRPTREELLARLVNLQTTIDRTGIGLLVVRVLDGFAGYCGLVEGQATLDEPELAYWVRVGIDSGTR